MKNKTENIKLQQYCEDYKVRKLGLIKYTSREAVYYSDQTYKCKLRKTNLAGQRGEGRRKVKSYVRQPGGYETIMGVKKGVKKTNKADLPKGST